MSNELLKRLKEAIMDGDDEGGGPITPEWALEIGADGYGRDARDAASPCIGLVKGDLKPPLAAPIMIHPLDTVAANQI